MSVLEHINKLIRIERTAMSQYLLQAKIAANAEYNRLAEHYTSEAGEESGHLDKLLARGLFLGLKPDMGAMLSDVEFIEDPIAMFAHDLKLESAANDAYKGAIVAAMDETDTTSRDLFEDIRADEEHAIRFLEAQQRHVEDFGRQNFLQGWK